jgi:hypothetical protein
MNPVFEAERRLSRCRSDVGDTRLSPPTGSGLALESTMAERKVEPPELRFRFAGSRRSFATPDYDTTSLHRISSLNWKSA